MGFLADGHVLLEDYPGLAKTLAARSFAQVAEHALLPDSVHAGPHAVGRHRLLDLEPARRRLRVPARPDLHQPPALGRDQPRSAEDPGRAARGDAGAPGDDRGRDASSRAAVPRHRHAEPDRVRGHLPAARGTARPLPAPHRVRLSGRENEVEVLDRRIEREADEVELEPVVDRETCWRCSGRWRGHVAESVRRYCVDLVVGDARVARARPSERARAEASRSSSSPAAGRRSPGATTCSPTTSRRSPSPPSLTGSCSAPSCGCSACPREDVVRDVLGTRPDAPRRGRRAADRS